VATVQLCELSSASSQGSIGFVVWASDSPIVMRAGHNRL